MKIEKTGTSVLKVHRIIDGPFHSWDVMEDPGGDYEGDFYFCQAIVEVDGEISEEELRFEDFQDFYEARAHLSKSIEPYVIEMEWVEAEE